MRKIVCICLAVLFSVIFAVYGCGSKKGNSVESDTENVVKMTTQDKVQETVSYNIYYTDQTKVKLVTEKFRTDEQNQAELINLLLDRMINGLENVEYLKAIPDGISIMWTKYDSGMSAASVSFSGNYYDLKPEEDILCRAAIVKTLTQIENIKYVIFYVGNNTLVDSDGNDISKMGLIDFVDMSDAKSYDRTGITLYFTDKSGKKLIECDREVVYESTASIERVAMSQLISGPSEGDLYPVVPDGLRVISISVSDGICYLNIDQKIMNNSLNVSGEVSIYAIVNTLTELPTVNKVQIVINGENLSGYGFNESFNEPLERNLDFVGTLEEASS